MSYEYNNKILVYIIIYLIAKKRIKAFIYISYQLYKLNNKDNKAVIEYKYDLYK